MRPRVWAGDRCMVCGGKRHWTEDGDVDVSTCPDCGEVAHFYPEIDLADYVKENKSCK